METILETSRLRVRKFALEDIERSKIILGDPEVMHYSLKGAIDTQGIKAYLQDILEHYKKYGYGLWALILKETGELIGLIGLIHQIVENEAYVELGYRLAKKFWGYGYATEAAKAIKKYAFETLNIERLISIISPANVASVKVAKRVGMEKSKSATFHGSFVDIYEVWKITLVPYDSSWQTLYKKEKQKLEKAFRDLPIRFYHIGSTSIPGCLAKPILDILGVTNQILSIDECNIPLEKLGYIPLGEYGMKQRRFFRKRTAPFVNLHIFEDTDPEITRHLRFSEYLIHHPKEIKRYSDVKQKLAYKHSATIIQYILGKESFIKEIDSRAAKEATENHWHVKMGPRKTAWTKEEILQAMETNMHLHMTYFAKYLSILTLYFEPGATVVMSEIPDDTFNYVLGAQFEEKYADQKIQGILELFNSKKLPFAWWVSERDRPISLSSLLEKHGLFPKEDDVGMYLELDTESLQRKNQRLLIQRVLTPNGCKDFSQVMVNIGGYPQVYEQFLKHIPPVLYGNTAPFEIYVGYIEECPVVTGILVLHAHVAGIYYIMTDPAYRKRGYATEMMLFLLLQAQNQGYHIATLQASASGKHLYQKLGFQEICRFVEYSYPI